MARFYKTKTMPFLKFKILLLIIIYFISLTACVENLIWMQSDKKQYLIKNVRNTDKIFSDLSVTNAAQKNLKQNRYLEDFNLNVDTYHQRVSIYGILPTYFLEKQALEVVWKTPGVKQVISNITVLEKK